MELRYGNKKHRIIARDELLELLVMSGLCYTLTDTRLEVTGPSKTVVMEVIQNEN